MNLASWLLLIVVAGLALWATWLRKRGAADRRQLVEVGRQTELLRDKLQARAERIDRYSAVVAGAGLGIMVIDPLGEVVQSNPAAERLFGVRHGAVLAQSRIVQLAAAAAATGSRLEEEFDIRSPLPRTLTVGAEPLGDSDWVVAYIEDVTERKKVDAARTDFVANVSHELKTPLGALTLLSETLENATDPAQQGKLISRIGEQAARMSRLVDDIMDLSLVEAAQMELAVVDLHKVLAEAAASVRDISAAADVEVSVESEAGTVQLVGDDRQLASAAVNLLSNAVGYTALAAPPRVVAAKAFHRGSDAVIEVTDSGIGIPAKHQQRIFERFYRVDSGRSRETGGTGLGLAIVRHVALNHGGSVEVESESGIGSTFRMVIPAGGEPAL